jgi:hypothetical protein
LKETKESTPFWTNITTCQKTCQKESNCFQWSWNKYNRNDKGKCYLGKTSELQSECKELDWSNYVRTTGQLSCPGINQTDKT